MTTTNATPATATRPLYWRLWAASPRELGYLLIAFPIALLGFTVTISIFSTGIGLLAVVIGLAVIIAALYVARGFGTLELVLLEWTGRPRIERPEWQDARARQGFWGWLRSLLANGHYWLYLLHTMVLSFLVSVVTWTITVTWLSVGVGGLGYWFWGRYLTSADRDWYLGDWLFGLFGLQENGVGAETLEVILYLLLGVIFIATLPFVTRGLVLLHYGIARGVLGAFKSDALQRQVIDLDASRGAAASAEGHSLRRLERDIHDGPQQRLVRLQMDIAAADRQLDADPAKARVLLAGAMLQSKEALEELRALSRGFAPPILLDRGLIAALRSAAVRNSVPTRVVDELPPELELPQEIERNAYFMASESLVNATKHSGATEVELRVGVHRIPDGDTTWLDVTVTDNGIGGAVYLPGHGLAGLEERLRGLGGTFEVSSPAGGPTTVSAHLPLTTQLRSSI